MVWWYGQWALIRCGIGRFVLYARRLSAADCLKLGKSCARSALTFLVIIHCVRLVNNPRELDVKLDNRPLDWIASRIKL
jgi:hypothetical protein